MNEKKVASIFFTIRFLSLDLLLDFRIFTTRNQYIDTFTQVNS